MSERTEGAEDRGEQQERSGWWRSFAERSPRSSPTGGPRRHDDTSLRAGLMGITAVAAATLVASVAGALISLLATLLF